MDTVQKRGAPSLRTMASNQLIRNIDTLQDIGGIPYSSVRHILIKINSPEQLRKLEERCPQIVGHTGEIWLKMIKRDFVDWDKKPHEPKNPALWWKVYLKLRQEDESDRNAAEEMLKARMASLAKDKEANKTELSGQYIREPKSKPKTTSSRGNGPRRDVLKVTPGGSKAIAKIRRQVQQQTERYWGKLGTPTHLLKPITRVTKAPKWMEMEWMEEDKKRERERNERERNEREPKVPPQRYFMGIPLSDRYFSRPPPPVRTVVIKSPKRASTTSPPANPRAAGTSKQHPPPVKAVVTKSPTRASATSPPANLYAAGTPEQQLRAEREARVRSIRTGQPLPPKTPSPARSPGNSSPSNSSVPNSPVANSSAANSPTGSPLALGVKYRMPRQPLSPRTAPSPKSETPDAQTPQLKRKREVNVLRPMKRQK